MDFKKLTEEQIEAILQHIENGFSIDAIVEKYDTSIREDVRAFVLFEQKLKASIATITPRKQALQHIVDSITLPKKVIPSPRFAYSILSPIALGRLLAPVAVFALIFILTTSESPTIPTENTEIATMMAPTEDTTARTVSTLATEEKRERAKAVVARLDEATPTTEMQKTAYTPEESDSSLSALYE
jgi:hypothetical protein